MIREGALYAVRIENRWKIPGFQFDRDGLVPNVGLVNAAVPNTLDPVSVLRWYTAPDSQLETADGRALSPLQWLKAGLPPKPVIEIGRDL